VDVEAIDRLLPPMNPRNEQPKLAVLDHKSGQRGSLKREPRNSLLKSLWHRIRMEELPVLTRPAGVPWEVHDPRGIRQS
jgi:hypothetical protein